MRFYHAVYARHILINSPVSLSVAILALSAAPTPSTSSHMSIMVVSVTPKSAFVSDAVSFFLHTFVDFVMARNNEIGEGFIATARCSLVLTEVADENRVC